MKLAVVSVAYNDDFKIEQWHTYYEQYKAAVDYHIIVDNGSENTFIKRMEEIFCKSVLIKRKVNGGSTGAYNTGIRYVLEHTDADAIMLLGNDIKISAASLIQLMNYLEQHSSVGMVAPIMCNADSEVVADFGCEIDNSLMLKPYMVGKKLKDIKECEHMCEAVTGGVNMAKRLFYKDVGLQDENLFMYSDEVDMGLRTKACGYEMACLYEAVCWHQHVNPPGSKYRKPYSAYLMARNKVYLANKHGLKKEKKRVMKTFMNQAIKNYAKGIIKKDSELREKAKYIIAGIIYGFRNDMASNKYTQY